MASRDLYSIIAGILPALLGLGLVDLYVSRDVSFVVVASGIVAIAVLMIILAALDDIARSASRRPHRRRS